MQWHEMAFAPREGFEPFTGRESVGCVWYRSEDEKWEIIRVGRVLDTGTAAWGFELREVATGNQVGIYFQAAGTKYEVELYGDDLMKHRRVA